MVEDSNPPAVVVVGFVRGKDDVHESPEDAAVLAAGGFFFFVFWTREMPRIERRLLLIVKLNGCVSDRVDESRGGEREKSV